MHILYFVFDENEHENDLKRKFLSQTNKVLYPLMVGIVTRQYEMRSELNFAVFFSLFSFKSWANFLIENEITISCLKQFE